MRTWYINVMVCVGCYVILFLELFLKKGTPGIVFLILITVLSTIVLILKLFVLLHQMDKGLNILLKTYVTEGEEDINATNLKKKMNKLTDVLNSSLSSQEMTDNYLLQEAQLAALQSQINPHFLFNTLESIRGFAYKSGSYEIAEMTEALSSMLRTSLMRTNALITIEQELENIQNYMSIQNFRFQNKFKLQVIYDQTDDTITQCVIPNLTLQPLVENAIYHGLENRTEQGIIRINIVKTEKRIVINVIDNGNGIPEEKLEQLYERLQEPPLALRQDCKSTDTHTGIGLDNINKRIKMKFGPEYGLHIYSSVDIMTNIEITLPIIYATGATDDY